MRARARGRVCVCVCVCVVGPTQNLGRSNPRSEGAFGDGQREMQVRFCPSTDLDNVQSLAPRLCSNLCFLVASEMKGNCVLVFLAPFSDTLCFVLSDGDFFTYTRHEPIGVCGQIIPVSTCVQGCDQAKITRLRVMSV